MAKTNLARLEWLAKQLDGETKVPVKVADLLALTQVARTASVLLTDKWVSDDWKNLAAALDQVDITIEDFD